MPGNQCNRFSKDDEFSVWINDRVKIDPSSSVFASDLFEDWLQFTTERGNFPGSRQLFGRRLKRIGYASDCVRAGEGIRRIYNRLGVAQ